MRGGAVQSAPGDDRTAVEYQSSSLAYAGSGGPVFKGISPASGAEGEGYNLAFENAPLTAVVKVVLGDIMGTAYMIDPRVQGTISLGSGRPMRKQDLPFVLENALRTSNAALLSDATGYRIVPLAEASGSGSTDYGTRVEPGHGMSVIPLRYTSAQALMPLLDTFATRSGAVRSDPARNLLLVQGTAAERRTAIDTVLQFDADWMRGQSVGIYPVRNSAPDPIVKELENLLDAREGGLSQSLVKFQAIGRLNSILVVSKRPDLLRTAATWISRLDRADATTGVRVYRMKYGDAKQTARLLSNLFVGGSGGLDTAENQFAPGSGEDVTTSGASGDGPLTTEDKLGVGKKSSGASVAPEAEEAEADLGDGGGSGPGALPGVRITADTANNSLLVYASQEQYRTIERTLLQLDQPQLQVAIEATVAEVTLNDDLSYGVQFYLTSKDLGLGRNNGSVGNTLASDVSGSFISQVVPGFNLLAGPRGQPRFILDALHDVTDVKVLSNPSLVVVDNQTAVLQVGDEVPVSTGSATVLSGNNTVVSTIEYKNTGIILKVVPRVNVNGQVRLEIEQEISNVANGGRTSTLTPTVSQRKVKSTVAVTDGQTVLLAGLISERQNSGRSGIPVLGSLPGIGSAFSHKSRSGQRTELIIFIRPQIIRDAFDASTVAEELRTKLRGTMNAGGPGRF
ncbi:type II secretion system secretin GspD [Terrihabitans sp. PJ23]|uniref:Type II secretion system secretin GspD n=1 Tax=Terrihabitans rhizophilus TaxID=3092662 RepID=A0ABU4RMV2_9HYPH|nr:type II secretion system secretin GspD [Terrihabitans sp. PJ23]